MARANSGKPWRDAGREKLFLPSHVAGPRMAKKCLGLTFPAPTLSRGWVNLANCRPEIARLIWAESFDELPSASAEGASRSCQYLSMLSQTIENLRQARAAERKGVNNER